MVIVASFGLWFVVIFAGRIALFGNPLYRMVNDADTALLNGVDAVMMGERQPATPAEVGFLRDFTRQTLLQLGMLVTELALLAHLWWVKILPALTAALMIKNLLSIVIGMSLAHRERKRGALAFVLAMPRTLIVAERIGAAISAVGALILFLVVNGMVTA